MHTHNLFFFEYICIHLIYVYMIILARYEHMYVAGVMFALQGHFRQLLFSNYILYIFIVEECISFERIDGQTYT